MVMSNLNKYESPLLVQNEQPPKPKKSRNQCQCGSKSLEKIDVGGISQITCTNCGTVQDEDFLREKAGFEIESGQSNPKLSFLECQRLASHFRYEKLKRASSDDTAQVTAAKKLCLDSITHLGQELKISRDMIKEAISLAMNAMKYERSNDGNSNQIKSKGFKNSHLQRRKSLASISVYLTAVKNNIPVIITDVCRIIDCKREDFAADFFWCLSLDAFKQYRYNSKSLGPMMPVVLRSMKVSQTEFNTICRKAVQILGVVNEVSSLTTGKSPIYLMIAASYLAWKSIHSKKSAMRFSDFAKATKLDVSDITEVKDKKNVTIMSNTVGKRIRALEENLIGLAKQLPWLKIIEINKKNVTQFLDDIFENQEFATLTIQAQQRKEKEALSPEDLARWNSRFDDIDGNQEIDDDEIDSYLRSEQEVEKVRHLFEAVHNTSDLANEKPNFLNVISDMENEEDSNFVVGCATMGVPQFVYSSH